jgi:threonine dehydratase
MKLGFAEVEAALARITTIIHRTPVLTCSALNQLVGAELYFKCENFQKTGAFKFRGAANALLSLTSEQCARGVATHSSGNHAQALAHAARLRGVRSYVVMPRTAPQVKVEAVRHYGAEISFCESTLEARQAALAELVLETGAHFVPPYDDPHIIAGQGTAALELLQEVPDLEVVIAPVGGGGLLAGTAIVARAKGVRQVFGAEPTVANDAYLSLRSGILQPTHNAATLADGLRGGLSELTFSLIRESVTDILLADEPGIRQAFELILERMKIVIEPSSAVPLAALLAQRERVADRRVGVILSGGNVDLHPH